MNAKRFFIVLLLILGLSIAAAVGSIYYGNKILASKSAELSKIKGERDASSDVIAKIKSAGGNEEDLKRLKELTDQVLPSQKKQSDLLADFLYTATSKAGISTRNIQNLSFGGSATPDPLSGASKSLNIPGLYEYPFTVQLKDIPYTQLILFFKELEQNKRLITIDNFQLTPSAINPNVISSVSLSVKTYLKP